MQANKIEWGESCIFKAGIIIFRLKKGRNINLRKLQIYFRAERKLALLKTLDFLP